MSERLRPRAIWLAILPAALALGALFQWLQLPAPWMLGQMVAGTLRAIPGGAAAITPSRNRSRHEAAAGLPLWLLDASYITIGLFVGLIFTLHSVIAILRVLPQLLAAG